MMAGIYYGAKYGGSTTSILLNIPGESSSVVTCLDGYQMARKGRAGAALGIAAIASFIAGTFGVIALQPDRAADCRLCAVVQLAGIFRADVPRARAGGAAVGAVAAQGAARDAGRAVAHQHRHRPLHRAGALHLRAERRCSAASTSWWSRSACSRSREVLASIEAGEDAKMLPVPTRHPQPPAELGGAQGLPLRVPQRLGHRLHDRRAAGRRRHHRVVHLLRHREGGVEASREIRPRRARGRGGAGGRQQRRHRRRAGAAAHARHSRRRHRPRSCSRRWSCGASSLAR